MSSLCNSYEVVTESDITDHAQNLMLFRICMNIHKCTCTNSFAVVCPHSNNA